MTAQDAETAAPDLVVVSNRGPLSFSYNDDGELEPRHGAGGLASAFQPLLRNTGVTWISGTVGDADREAASNDLFKLDGAVLVPLAPDTHSYRMAYDVISNATLWFLYHGLFDLARRPRFERRWYEAWEHYREINNFFAAAVAERAPENACVLVQDYHLSLMGARLREQRPDLRTVHFSHTPFCSPDEMRILPGIIASELLGSLVQFDTCGFHTQRWADAFRDCCKRLDIVSRSGPGGSDASHYSQHPPTRRSPSTFSASLSPDTGHLASITASEACKKALSALEHKIGDRKLILRVDRMDLSKNFLRGFLAYDELLHQEPALRERVLFLALAYTTRGNLADYAGYRLEVNTLVNQINERWATPGWTPIILEVEDDLVGSVAALQRYDVLLVNPLRDGLNLVAKEGALVNTHSGVLVLSREAGVFEELGDLAIEINPFDISGTASAMSTALQMDASDRLQHSSALRQRVTAQSNEAWLQRQIAAASRVRKPAK
ncbi:MAG: trehalose-6-phosphate synthase [Actinomycetota bacterium]|jgi:trehalose 6-phosphate synthase|nr:trehalose-6-phosphate synthase [Actinomycetota bacterium]